MDNVVTVKWKDGGIKGKVAVSHGRLQGLDIGNGEGTISGECFQFESSEHCALDIKLSDATTKTGAFSTIVTVHNTAASFSFFLRDVGMDYPIYIPAYGAVVTLKEDGRNYDEIAAEIASRSLNKAITSMEMEAEESYDSASVKTKSYSNSICLGLSRDVRVFSVGFKDVGSEQFDWVQPSFQAKHIRLPEANDEIVRYNFSYGRGLGCCNTTVKRLEDGALPILHAQSREEYIIYNITAFATLEKNELNACNLHGTHHMVATMYSHGGNLTEKQQEECEKLLPTEIDPDEEVVLYYRVEAVNTAMVPKYAWFNIPVPNGTVAPSNFGNGINSTFEGNTGFGIYESGRVYFIARLDGKPLQEGETAVMVKPGKASVFEILLPHRPIPRERAMKLAQTGFPQKQAECKSFWEKKLESSTNISVPEQRINEMVKAGLLHLDIVTYGKEPDGATEPVAGLHYSSIGSESAPMILFYDSVGWHDLARRSVMHFLERQGEDGSILTFADYVLETGAVLWAAEEHYRYTKDIEWVKQIKPRLLKACNYLSDWSDRNKLESLRNRGYGMLDGKCADMQDNYHAFMLSGYSYLGLSRTAQMLADCDPEAAEKIGHKAQEFKGYIRDAFFANMANSPVIPLGDGSWCPSVSPWTEYRGPVCLFTEGGNWYSHAGVTVRDATVGSLWLVFQEVIDWHEPAAGFMMDFLCEYMFMNNVSLGQPYYSRHPWVHLKRGEVGAFLKTYYNCLSVMADRETYTFSEDSYPGAFHKTHEEAWFLVETRWMLYMEDGDTLKLLPGIPRKWMEHGKKIDIGNAASYFGHFSLKVESKLQEGLIEGEVLCDSGRKPDSVTIRLPHPQRRRASSVKGGRYDAASESVVIDDFDGHAKVELYF